ncbi:MAG: hypothetical protein AAF378_25625 [Cyanobacteria bacterium P01_A01_bin.84]
MELKLSKKFIVNTLLAVSLLGIAAPKPANAQSWLELWQMSEKKFWNDLKTCSQGNQSVCDSLDRRTSRDIRINQGAAASQSIRNGVQGSYDNMIQQKNYNNAVENADYYCNQGDVDNCIYWGQVIDSYYQR